MRASPVVVRLDGEPLSSVSPIASSSPRIPNGDVAVSSGGSAKSAHREMVTSDSAPPSPPIVFSFKSLVVVYGVVISDGIALNIINPFISEICRERFGMAEDNIGLAAGWLVGAFSVAVFFSSFFLGHLSDLYGRKKLMLLGLATGCFCTIAFGLSTSFALALLVRTIAGITNANVSLAKTVISDVPSSQMSNEQRSLAFAYLGGVFQLSRAVAAGTAGIATGVHIFGYDNDFFFPCLIGGTFNFIFLVFCSRYLPETLQKKKKPQARPAAAITATAQLESPHPKQSSKYQRLDRRKDKKNDNGEDGEEDDSRLVIVVPASCPSPSVDLELEAHHSSALSSTLNESDATALADVDLGPAATLPEEEEGETCSTTCRYVFTSMLQGLKIVWADHLIRRINMISCLHAFGNGSFILLVSLFGALDLEHGGLQMTPAQIGMAYVWFGAVCLTFQLFCYKHVHRRFGLFRTYLAGTLLLGAAAATMPLAAAIKKAEQDSLHLDDPTVMSTNASDYMGSSIVYALIIAGLGVGFMVALPIISTCLSHSVQGSNFRGLTQGVCQSLQSGVRGLGAMITGSAFSHIALSTRHPGIVFWCLAALNLICFAIAWNFTPAERDRCTGKTHAPAAADAATPAAPETSSPESSEIRLDLEQEEESSASPPSSSSKSRFGGEVELHSLSPRTLEDTALMLPSHGASSSDEPIAGVPKRAPNRKSRKQGLYAQVEDENEKDQSSYDEE